MVAAMVAGSTAAARPRSAWRARLLRLRASVWHGVFIFFLPNVIYSTVASTGAIEV
jgi:hypothetical protein